MSPSAALKIRPCCSPREDLTWRCISRLMRNDGKAATGEGLKNPNPWAMRDAWRHLGEHPEAKRCYIMSAVGA